MEIYSPAGTLPILPDDLTIPQFIFEFKHGTRPTRGSDVPWLIEDETGRGIGGNEVSLIIRIVFCQLGSDVMVSFPVGSCERAPNHWPMP